MLHADGSETQVTEQPMAIRGATISPDGSRVAFMADYPSSDPSGGPAEVALAYQVIRPTNGSAAFTATTRNAVASY